MKRHDIRLRKEEFGTNRIKQYKDYKQLMRKHHRASRSKTMVQSAVAVVLLIFITGIVYFTNSTNLDEYPFVEGPKINVDKGYEVIEFEEMVVNVVGSMATPDGGLKAYGNYLQKNIEMPEAAKDAGIKGIVNVQFLVSKEGLLSDFRIVNSLGYGCDEEALRLIKEGPGWIPGEIDGEPQEGGMIVPVIFFKN